MDASTTHLFSLCKTPLCLTQDLAGINLLVAIPISHAFEIVIFEVGKHCQKDATSWYLAAF